LRADSYRSPSSIAAAIPVSWSVTEVLIITDDPPGMRARTASRAATKSSTTSTLKPCSSRATTVAASDSSSGSLVKRSDCSTVVILAPSCRDTAEDEDLRVASHPLMASRRSLSIDV